MRKIYTKFHLNTGNWIVEISRSICGDKPDSLGYKPHESVKILILEGCNLLSKVSPRNS